MHWLSNSFILWLFFLLLILQHRQLLKKELLNVLTYQTPILFLLITRILMFCTWLSFLKENGLSIIPIMAIFSSLFDLFGFDLNENIGTRILAIYTALFTPCIPLQQNSYFHLFNSLLSQGCASQIYLVATHFFLTNLETFVEIQDALFC